MHKFLSFHRSINTVLERLVMTIGALIVALMVVVVFGGAITRYVTGIGFNVVLELPPMLMPWLVFPLAGALLRNDTHIAVDFLPDRLSASGRRYLRAFVSAIAILAGVTFTIAGLDAVTLFKLIGQVTEMEWEFPIWWIYLSFPVGFVILTSFAVENFFKALVDTEGPGSDEARAVSG